ncbi:hypothetical protein CP49_15100 [Bradyrhizobium valentinum]|uniref:DUF6894 domain-containing protein n=2 Tax=Bradyrhizobium valentinum TaxID=1518501 RepID=A0A0R3LE90_9BRAD|nr:hypothetical protein CP49_15100 [Bradyrhizobium valentinum]
MDLPDLSAAKREAMLTARELLVEAIKSGKQTVPEAFVIADDEGRALDTISLAAVLPATSKRVQRPFGISRSQYAGNSRSAFGNLMMYCAASRSVTSGFRPGTMIGSKNR